MIYKIRDVLDDYIKQTVEYRNKRLKNKEEYWDINESWDIRAHAVHNILSILEEGTNKLIMETIFTDMKKPETESSIWDEITQFGIHSMYTNKTYDITGIPDLNKTLNDCEWVRLMIKHLGIGGNLKMYAGDGFIFMKVDQE